MPSDHIPLPTSIHAILGRWVVHFSLMSEDVESTENRPLALIGRLSHMQRPCASLEELVQLREFVDMLLDREEVPVPHLMTVEAVQLCCWLRPYLGPEEV